MSMTYISQCCHLVFADKSSAHDRSASPSSSSTLYFRMNVHWCLLSGLELPPCGVGPLSFGVQSCILYMSIIVETQTVLL